MSHEFLLTETTNGLSDPASTTMLFPLVVIPNAAHAEEEKANVASKALWRNMLRILAMPARKTAVQTFNPSLPPSHNIGSPPPQHWQLHSEKRSLQPRSKLYRAPSFPRRASSRLANTSANAYKLLQAMYRIFALAGPSAHEH